MLRIFDSREFITDESSNLFIEIYYKNSNNRASLIKTIFYHIHFYVRHKQAHVIQALACKKIQKYYFKKVIKIEKL